MEDLLARAEALALADQPGAAADIYQSLLAEPAAALGLLLHNLTTCLLKSRRPEAALRAAQAACQFAPGEARTWMTLSHIESRFGLREAALASLYRGLEIEPTNRSFHETRLWNLAQKLDPLDYRKEAQAWFSSLPVPGPYRHNPPALLPVSSRVRVGYVSGDFRQHVMDRFIEPLLTHFNRERFEVFCFDNTETETCPVRQHLQSLPDVTWVRVQGLEARQAADLVRQAGIDVLVDLAGLSAFNRLDIFQERPAAVQITGIGFLPTTGADCFDWRLADYEHQYQYTEPLWKLPRVASPLPLHPQLPITELPASRNGFITFGYVNGLHKLSPDSIRQFVEVLQQVPNSRLILMMPGASDPASAAAILRRFDPVQDRIMLTESNGGEAFCTLFKDIDICLDPAPYGGCTTTIDCLFHGVPVATSLPDRRLAADAYFLQREMGLGPTGDLLVDACALAEDLERLAGIRQSLRGRYLAHPVGDPERVVRVLESAYLGMLEHSRAREAA